MADQRYTVLGQAGVYQRSIPRPSGGGPREPFRTLAEAQASLLPQVARVAEAVEGMPASQRLDEVLIEVQMDTRYLAKSYHPKALLNESGLHLRGSSTWPQTLRSAGTKTDGEDGEPITVESRSLYVSVTLAGIARLTQIILEPRTESLESDVIGIQRIRVPGPSDRMISNSVDSPQPRAVEIVLYAWDPKHRIEAVQRIKDLILKSAPAAGTPATEIIEKTYTNGPTFIAAVVTPAVMQSLAEFNFLRLARPLPRVALTRMATGMTVQAPTIPAQTPTPAAWVAIFDGGVEINAHLKPYVQAFDETTRPALPDLINHGTGVVSAAIYGHIPPEGGLPPAVCGAFSYRVLPDPRHSDLELYGVIDTLERIVPRLPAHVKVVNLSFGPDGPIDRVPTRFTYAIDRLSYETDKIFVTAVGNDGHKLGRERIQSPADSVNNIAVGAHTWDPTTGEKIPAPYSCSGPGRTGCARKPDVIAFGGSSGVPFYVLDPRGGTMSGTDGTSYAAPTVAAVCANLLARVEGGVTTQASRALLIHSAQQLTGDASRIGWGTCAASAEHVLTCTPTRVSVLYEGMLSPQNSWKLPFLVPPDFDGGGNVTFSWTIVYCPDVDHASAGEYTLAGIQLQMRPHARRYYFSKKHEKSILLDLDVDKERVEGFVADGWKQGPLPAPANNKAKSELALRATEAKWDTVVRDQIGKQSGGIKDPMLTISILGRGDWDARNPDLQARFGAVLTVNAPKYKGDLYAKTIQAWDRLRPLTLRPDLDQRIRL